MVEIPAMGDKDIISKRILKNLARDFATYLFGLPVVEVTLVETQNQRVEERRADLVAKVTLADGETFLLHVEIQNGNDGTRQVTSCKCWIAQINSRDEPTSPGGR